MDKREKHTRIIEHYEVHGLRHFQRFTERHGIRLFSDEAVEEYAAWLVKESRLTQKKNRENRARAAAAAAHDRDRRDDERRAGLIVSTEDAA